MAVPFTSVQWVSFMDGSWQSIFHFLQGYGKHLPRGFHLSNCHISNASQGERICWCLPKPTHPLPQFLFQFLLHWFFFSWPPSQDLSRSSCEITKRKGTAALLLDMLPKRVQSNIWHFAPILHHSSLFIHSLSLSLLLHQISCVLSAMPL